MDKLLLIFQVVQLDRPPTQLEVEAELMTPGKSGRPQSSTSRGGGSNPRGLQALKSEVEAHIQDVKGELQDVKNSIKELLLEFRKQRLPSTAPSSSEVGNTGLEEAHLEAAKLPDVSMAIMDPVWGRNAIATNTEVHVTQHEVAEGATKV